MPKELRQAERALARGRADEALVYLWNALEPARIEGDEHRLADLARVARLIEQTGDGAQQREAARLLERLRPPEAAREREPPPVATETEVADRQAEPEEEAVEILVPERPGGEGAVEAGEEKRGQGQGERQGGLRRLLVPLFFLALLVVNLVSRLADR